MYMYICVYPLSGIWEITCLWNINQYKIQLIMSHDCDVGLVMSVSYRKRSLKPYFIFGPNLYKWCLLTWKSRSNDLQHCNYVFVPKVRYKQSFLYYLFHLWWDVNSRNPLCFYTTPDYSKISISTLHQWQIQESSS